MKILNQIFNIASDNASSIIVTDVRIGLGYIAVLLENNQAGLAYTFREDFIEGCSLLHGSLPLAGKKALELLRFLNSDHSIKTAVGLATVNALMNNQKPGMNTGDVIRNIEIRPGDQIGMVGLFTPLIAHLKDKGASLKIFEQNPKRQTDETLPIQYMKDELPKCQVAIITSTSLLNQTIEDLLILTKGCREVVMLGPSTPLIPEAFKDTPASWLSGVIIVNSNQILRIVSEGGGMRDFHNYIRKVNIRL
ncbi:MAG: Rossmann-like domain-containing protein [bacterium]